MDQIQKTFNLYCDESCHIENDHKKFMLLGYIMVPYNQLVVHKEAIDNLKRKHHFYAEIKWSKVSYSQAAFYSDLVDYFFSSDLFYRAIIIEKEKIRAADFDLDFDTFYYRMYHQLLFHKLESKSGCNSYNIYLDVKDTLGRAKVRELREVLCIHHNSIRNLQIVDSRESLFLQLADFFTGALNYNLNEEGKVTAKRKLIERIKRHSGFTLDSTTSRTVDKFNLFFIELQ